MKTQSPITSSVLKLSVFAASLILCATTSFAAQSAQPQTIEDIINTQISYQSPASISSGTDAAAAQDTLNNLYNIGTLPASTSDQQNHVAAAPLTTDARTLATAPSSPLVTPYGLALDSSGNLYVADSGANAIWKITNNSQIALLAGDSVGASGSTDGKGTAARFDSPLNLIVRSGTLYATDAVNNTIRTISPDGTVRTLAGSSNSGSGYSEGTGTKAAFYDPVGIAVDGSGKFYVTDRGNSVIRKLTTAGVTSWLAGEVHIPGDWWSFNFVTTVTMSNISGTAGIFDLNAGTLASGTYALLDPNSGALCLNGDSSSLVNYFVISDTNSLWLAFGTNALTSGSVSSLGDGTLASGTYVLLGSSTDATLTPTTPQAAAPIGSEFRALETTIPLSQLVTTATETYASGTYSFYSLFGMSVSPDGNYLYACNTDPAICAIKISDGTVIPLDTAIFGSETNPLLPVSPRNLRFDSQGNLYIADTGNSRILKVAAADSTVSCLAGGGTPDDYGNYQSGYQDGPAATALFNAPTDIAIDSAGNVYVADSGNGLIRKIDTNNNVTTLALEEVALADLAPSTTPSTAETSADTSGGSDSSGGGAPSALYLLALGTLAVTRLRRR